MKCIHALLASLGVAAARIRRTYYRIIWCEIACSWHSIACSQLMRWQWIEKSRHNASAAAMHAELMAALLAKTLCSSILVALWARAKWSTRNLQKCFVDFHSAQQDAWHKAATICWVARLEDDSQFPLLLPAPSATETKQKLDLCCINHTPGTFDSNACRCSTAVDIDGTKLASSRENSGLMNPNQK